jgi:hypothetical protein
VILPPARSPGNGRSPSKVKFWRELGDLAGIAQYSAKYPCDRSR